MLGSKAGAFISDTTPYHPCPMNNSSLVLFVLHIHTFYVVTCFNQSLHYLSFLFIKSYANHLFKIVLSPIEENNPLGREKKPIPVTESACIFLDVFSLLLYGIRNVHFPHCLLICLGVCSVVTSYSYPLCIYIVYTSVADCIHRLEHLWCKYRALM